MPRRIERTADEAPSMISRLGPLEVDWPRSLGYFGGVALAVAFDVIAPPLGLFIAAIPSVKLFKAPGGAWPLRIVADVLDGAAKPVGGDSEGSVRWAPPQSRPADKQSGAGRANASARLTIPRRGPVKRTA